MKTQSSSASAIFAGSAIGLYAVFDTLILGLPILVLAVRYNSLVVFGIAVLSVFLLNVACCTWVDAELGLFADRAGRPRGSEDPEAALPASRWRSRSVGSRTGPRGATRSRRR